MKHKQHVLKAKDEEFNRKAIENKSTEILADLEHSAHKTSLKHLDSGLNHVLANIATRNKISIGLDLEKARHLDRKDKAICLSCIIQNLKICRKAKTSIAMKGSKEQFYTLLSIGASTQQAKQALTKHF